MIRLMTLLIFVALPISSFAETTQTLQTDAVTGIQTWQTENDGVHFSLTQILPEQAQAFYVNRGFTLEQIDSYVQSCVYMAVFRNDSASGSVHFISNNWQVSVNDNLHPLKSVKNWVNTLTTTDVTKPALLAFRWAQFPNEHTYEPGGDWNQGMLSIGLSAGVKFSINAVWDVNQQSHESTLKGVQCAR